MPAFALTVLSIFRSGLPCCLLALGIFITFRILDFADLTAEGSFLIGGALSIALIRVGVNPIVATLVSVAGGGLCGYLTSIFYTKLKIPKILCGIITMTASSTIAMLILGITVPELFLNNISLIEEDITIYSLFEFGDEMYRPLSEALVMLVIVVVVFLIIYFFFGTEYGMAIRATGINEKMARAQGINTERASIVALILSNALIGLGGSLYCQNVRSCNANMAIGFLVIGLASILIGEAIFGRRSFKNNLISIGLGAIIYFVIVTIAIDVFKIPTDFKKLLYAVLIALALSLPLIKSGIKTLVQKLRKKHA